MLDSTSMSKPARNRYFSMGGGRVDAPRDTPDGVDRQASRLQLPDHANFPENRTAFLHWVNDTFLVINSLPCDEAHI